MPLLPGFLLSVLKGIGENPDSNCRYRLEGYILSFLQAFVFLRPPGTKEGISCSTSILKDQTIVQESIGKKQGNRNLYRYTILV